MPYTKPVKKKSFTEKIDNRLKIYNPKTAQCLLHYQIL